MSVLSERNGEVDVPSDRLPRSRQETGRRDRDRRFAGARRWAGSGRKRSKARARDSTSPAPENWKATIASSSKPTVLIAGVIDIPKKMTSRQPAYSAAGSHCAVIAPVWTTDIQATRNLQSPVPCNSLCNSACCGHPIGVKCTAARRPHGVRPAAPNLGVNPDEENGAITR